MLQEAELGGVLIQRTTSEGSSETMYYIGLDVHRGRSAIAGCVFQEGKIESTRRGLDARIKTLPQPPMIAMEVVTMLLCTLLGQRAVSSVSIR